MAKKMLIDATHPEETRVVVADGNKVEEFDFESRNRRQLAGNIYLAKVTRVEPSLQAAFIEYGGNRHGFLAFAEIHPDYYQIPKADRDAILAEERAYAEAQAAADEAAAVEDAAAGDAGGGAEEAGAATSEAERGAKPRSRSRSRSRSRRKAGDDAPRDEGDDAAAEGDAEAVIAQEGVDAVVTGGAADVSEAAADADADEDAGADGAPRTMAESTGLEDETVTAEPEGMETVDLARDDGAEDDADDAAVEAPEPARARRRDRPSDRDEGIEAVGDRDQGDDARGPRVQRPKARRYKIQEVVKVRQIMLVQVVKEERGNKGAALTTYLSLAGRYCVLMPNTARGGGISRKITNAADRSKLKEIAQEIDVPQGAGLIVRTAGAKRTKSEIKRDYEYLKRQWEQVRALTLRSIAPAPIYEEGNLIHRAIRDYYSSEIDEVIVAGEAGFREARDYMGLIVPDRVRDVKPHEGSQPLFARHGVEDYLASMFSPTVQLRSGGYIVIGITEALVAIDVNSGRSTREGSIEETATKTNLEAADEIARQMRLRDLAGLIVIDFIDMDERRNNAAVEKRMKDALKGDRARIQMGRISGFGLMELSRQRLRPGMLEATTQGCPHCHGTGLIRSDDSVALQVLRALEEEGGRGRSREVTARVPVKVANYLLNDKREHLASIEQRYDMAIRVEADPALLGDEVAPIEKSKTSTRVVAKPSAAIATDTTWTSGTEGVAEDDAADEAGDEGRAEAVADGARPDDAEARPDRGERPDGEGGRRKRRRRSRRRRTDGEEGAATDEAQDGDDDGGEEASAPDIVADAGLTVLDDSADAGDAQAATKPAEAAADAEAPARSRSRSRTRARKPVAEAVEAAEADAEAQPAPEAEPEKPARKSRSRAKARTEAPEAGASTETVAAAAAADAALQAVEAPQPEPQAAPEVAEPEPEPEPQPAAAEAKPEQPPVEAAKPKRRGWWSFGS